MDRKCSFRIILSGSRLFLGGFFLRSLAALLSALVHFVRFADLAVHLAVNDHGPLDILQQLVGGCQLFRGFGHL